MSENDAKVLVNEEGQYSLWPSYLDVPKGWEDTGVGGSREDCLAYVNEVWTDMRPLSLQKQMAESES